MSVGVLIFVSTSRLNLSEFAGNLEAPPLSGDAQFLEVSVWVGRGAGGGGLCTHVFAGNHIYMCSFMPTHTHTFGRTSARR